MAHIVEDLFRRPVSELLGDVTNSLNRLLPPRTKTNRLHFSLPLLSGKADRTANEITPGSFPSAGFSVRQT
jgi:hypothetical protein